MPANFRGTLPTVHGEAPPEAGAQWWKLFNDPVLTRLVTRALDANYDMRLAAARLREARARWLEAGTELSPTMHAVGEYRRQNLPPDEKNQDKPLRDIFVSGFDATWEADLFGRVRSLTSAARASVDAQVAVSDDLAVTLAAEVARNYFELRGQQESLAALRRSVELRAVELDLTRRRAAMGEANVVDLAAARQNLNSQMAHVGDLDAAISRTIRRLSVLTAQLADELYPVLAAQAHPGNEPAALALGTPADLLRRRPDIRQAEQELVASSSIEDAAKAELFPRLTFNGQLSFFAYGWGIGPSLSWDVFDRRRVKAHQVQAAARGDAAFAHYQLTVLTAVEDVENVLASLKAARDRRDVLKSSLEESAKIVEYTRRRAGLGVSNKIEIVAAELEEANASGVLAAQEAVVREAWVAVFKALGAGWQASARDRMSAPRETRGAPELPAGAARSP